MADVVKLGQPVVFRPGTASDERWGPGQFLSAMVTSIQGNQASLLVFPDAYAPYFEIRVARDDSLSVDRTWTPTTGEDQTMPEAPSDGQIYGRRNQAWTPVSGEDQGFLQAVIISDTPPAALLPGVAWFDTTINNFYVFEQGKWVEPAHVNPPEEVSVNIYPPTIEGIVGLDEVVTCNPGQWTSNPSSYLFQWRRDGNDLVGQTTAHYTIVVADVQHQLSCAVVAINVLGVSQQAVSNSVWVREPLNVLAPFISGTVAIGSVFSSTNAAWDTSSPIEAYNYQWYRTGVAIAGATASSYTLVAADAETDLTCTVVAVNAVGPSLPAISNTANIRTPVIKTAPAINGQVVIGGALSSSNGEWFSNPTSFTYQWYRGAVAIAGATSQDYVIVVADGNNNISCRVTASNAIGTSVPAPSNSFFIATPAISIAPIISGGILFTGTTLSCSTGIWISNPSSFTYQWRRNGGAISGGTSNTYLLTLVDQGVNITCDVIATNGIGSSPPATSNSLLIRLPTQLDTATVLNATVEDTTSSGYKLHATHTTTTTGGARSVAYKTTGKWMFELTVLTTTGAGSRWGVIRQAASYQNSLDGFQILGVLKDGSLITNTAILANVGAVQNGDNLSFIIDYDNAQFWIRRNLGPWNADPAAVPGVSGGLDTRGGTGPSAPGVCFGGAGASAIETVIFRFGAQNMTAATPIGYVPGWPV